MSSMLNSCPRRPTAAGSAPRGLLLPLVLIVLLALSGCGSQFMDMMGRREKVVVFENDTPRQVRLKVREACSEVPRTTPAPLPTGSDHKATRLTGVRFRVDDASQRDLAELYECLNKFDSVAGIQRD